MSACKTKGCICSDHCRADMDSDFKEHPDLCCDCLDFEGEAFDLCCEECDHAEPEE